jgi:hypothetical protein
MKAYGILMIIISLLLGGSYLDLAIQGKCNTDGSAIFLITFMVVMGLFAGCFSIYHSKH